MRSESIRKASALLTVGLAVAVGYVGWVFLERHLREKRYEENVREETAQAYSPYANQELSELRILHFYASPPKLTAGEEALLCYGVQGAQSVTISNVDETLKPTRNRCLIVKPATSTTYTIAVEASGNQGMASETLRLEVDPSG